MTFRVLFVCIGNVCRSPLAERLLAHRLADGGVGDRFTVASAGVRAMRGKGMHPESARTLRERGGDPDGFVARQLLAQEVEAADLVLAATLDVRSRVLEEAPRALRRTFTIREFAALAAAATGVDEPEAAPGSRGAHAAPPEPEVSSLSEFVALCAEARSALQLDDYDVADPIGRAPAVYDEVAVVLDEDLKTLSRALVTIARVG